ncbi:fungal-specific transcription factor domain-containing protein [Xylariales sp. PMI_506]|nr:fungal-specific transcription factor domain-containing protein [Xylariales sp. PMI_506]
MTEIASPRGRRAPGAAAAAAAVTPQLSCQLCRDRKVRCDKLEPCTNCVSAGVVCLPIHRQRLPRGRHAVRVRSIVPATAAPASAPAIAPAAVSPAALAADGDLMARINRLEALLEGVGSVAGMSERETRSTPGQLAPSPENANGTHNSSREPSRTDGERNGLLGQRPERFWASLVEEIHGLRGVIESTIEDVDTDSIQAPDPMQADSIDGGIKVFGLSGSNAQPPPQQNPTFSGDFSDETGKTTRELILVYLNQVDPIIKILHRPSLERWMLRGEAYMGYATGHTAVNALRSAICYAAASSMTDDQCQTTFHTAKAQLVAQHRRTCESAMERSGLLATQDITVLQAFVLYLTARKMQDKSRAVWTLVAVAVRIARGLRLGLSPDSTVGKTETFFAQQMRTRLWLTICVMDMQASVFQGSEPLIKGDEITPALALQRHINDSDFDPKSTQPISDREELTDNTFALVTYHLQLVGRGASDGSSNEDPGVNDIADPVCNVDSSTSRQNQSSGGGQQPQSKPQQQMQRFEETAFKLLHFCDPETSPFAWFVWHGTHCLVATVRLYLLSPFQGKGSSGPSPRHKSDARILRQAAKVLEKTQIMHTAPRGEGFRWYITTPWPVLAMALAECYVSTDKELVAQAWPIIESSYQHYEAVISRNSGGRLRGPLGELMRETRRKTAALVQSGTHDTISSIPRFPIQESSARREASGTTPGDAVNPPTNTLNNSAINPSLVTMTNPSSAMLLSPLGPHLNSPGSDNVLAPEVHIGQHLAPEDSDQQWKTWEELLGGMAPNFFETEMSIDDNDAVDSNAWYSW